MIFLENSFFVEYPSFIEQYEKILEHFGMDITPKGVEASKEMLRYNSKSKETARGEKMDHRSLFRFRKRGFVLASTSSVHYIICSMERRNNIRFNSQRLTGCHAKS